MSKKGKKYLDAIKNIDKAKTYGMSEGLDLVKNISFADFDETVDIAVRLGVDPRHAEQMVRGAVVLPNGLGKKVTVLVFAQGEKASEAKDAGADYVGDEDLVKKISSGWLEFDKIVASPDMMKYVGKLGKLLGPRGLMPSPKVGTVTNNVADVVKKLKAGMVEFRVDKAGIIHAPIGKKSFGTESLVENCTALVDLLMKLKPAAAKGQYIRGAYVSTTMGPSVRVGVV